MFKKYLKKITLIAGLLVVAFIITFVKISSIDTKVGSPKIVLSADATNYAPIVKQVIVITSKMILKHFESQ